jgi:flagellar hook-basal body complex protein FliE
MRVDPLIRNLADGAANLNKPKVSEPGSFADQLKDKLGEIDQLQKSAEHSMAEGALEGATNVHETMIRLEEADVGLRLLTRFRNKAIDAYHEVMRMQF